MTDDRFKISADEMHHRMSMQEERHDKPLREVAGLIEDALRKVRKTLGVDVTQEDVASQQFLRGIVIAERPPEEMGELAGHFVIAEGTPIAIVGDPWLGSDGLAYLDILWLKEERKERFGGVRIIQ